MANAVTIQNIIDGPRNAIVKITGILDTSDVAPMQVVIPQNLMQMTDTNKPPLLRVNHIDYSIGTPLEIILSWGLAAAAGPGAPILPIAGRGRMSFDDFSGLTNNQAGSDGSIWLATTGFNIVTAPKSVFSVILELIKAGQINTGVQ